MELVGYVVGATGLAAGLVLSWHAWRGRHAADLARVELEREQAQVRLAGREQVEAWRQESEAELRDRRQAVQAAEERLAAREEAVARRQADLERREGVVAAATQDLSTARREVEAAQQAQLDELARLAGLSAEEARRELLARVEERTREESARRTRLIEEEARRDAERRGREIIATAMERCAVDLVSETSVAVVALTGDDVKGRIIGREGRNIRSFEQLTGVDLVIDDTPEAVVISAFDPIRREVARLALEALVADGRIHPGRIEEVVERSRHQVEEQMAEAGETAVHEAGVRGLAPALLDLLGRLHYRTSYGQNVLRHSLEVSRLAVAMGAELGADVEVLRRAGLLHDLGKALSAEVEGPHALLGGELAAQHGEAPAVCHAIAAHHRDVEPASVEATLVLLGDAISAARPGARRDTLESYVQRLERLESMALGHAGVLKAFAIQAGREIRVLVQPELVDDQRAAQLAREIAEEIQSELAYPGQIKVTVIREQRVVEYAQ